MNHLFQVIKSDGTKQLFEEEKLVNSLKRVGATPEAIDEIVENISKNIVDGMTTTEIYRQAFALLRNRSRHTASKYSLRRALMELGPDGFPFEKLVSKIFQKWGYETLVGEHVMGSCIEHEVDVVAWRSDELAMVEAKFHNEFGLKSDVKVALYVKARFDDISGNVFSYGGMTRRLSERWLITNTKFTDQAIKYGECNRLRMIGWNYPHRGNLHEIIETDALHPITCVPSLSKAQRKDLIGRGYILCVDVINQPKILDDIGIHGVEAQKILDEIMVVRG